MIFKFFRTTPGAVTAGGPPAPSREQFEYHARPVMVLAVTALCFWGMWDTGRAGISRYLSVHGMAAGSLDAVTNAVDWSPADPEAHSARGLLLSRQGKFTEAADDFEAAITLRPRDYSLWLELGHVRAQLGDEPGALAAYREAARLVPFYAQPRWHLGSFLLKTGQRDEAFTELQRAATRDRTLLTPFIELAWEASGHDAAALRQTINPQNTAAQIALARFFIKRGYTSEGLALYHAANSISNKDRRDIIDELVAAQNFTEAIEILHAPNATDRDRDAVLAALMAAKRPDEALTLLRETGASERGRRTVLTEAMAAGKYNEVVALLRDTGASDQERRMVLTGLLEAKRLNEALDLTRAVGAAPRDRRLILDQLLPAKMFTEAVALLRATGGAPDQDWRAVLAALLTAKEYTLAIDLLRASGGEPERERRALLASLLAAKRFGEAYEVWSLGRVAENQRGGIFDGGFEGRVDSDEPGFGWRLPRGLQAVRLAADPDGARSGAQSLRVEWNGSSKLGSQVISQLVLVEPGAHYRLSFAARTQEIVSAGLPVIVITDASGESFGSLLAQINLPQGSTPWQNYTLNFTAPGRATGVYINIQRQTCTTLPCPIYGSAWFDDFSLQKQ